ncbi:hypothetical protein D3C85_15140 [compost metagenome]
MHLHFQDGPTDHIFAFQDDDEFTAGYKNIFSECAHYCEQGTVPYVRFRYELSGGITGTIVVMSHSVSGRERDCDYLIDHIRSRLTIFTNELFGNIELIS